MDTLIILKEVSIVVMAVIMILVLIFLIPVLFQIRRIAREGEKLIEAVRAHVGPISRDIGLISRDTKSIVQSIHRQVDRVEDGIETVHDMAIRVTEFQRQIQRKVEVPLLQLAAVLGSVKNGVEAMARIIRR